MPGRVLNKQVFFYSVYGIRYQLVIFQIVPAEINPACLPERRLKHWFQVC
jgi:hypothetical protein